MVQWLRLQAAGGPGSILGQGARSHRPQPGVHTPQERSHLLQLRSGAATETTGFFKLKEKKKKNTGHNRVMGRSFPKKKLWCYLETRMNAKKPKKTFIIV